MTKRQLNTDNKIVNKKLKIVDTNIVDTDIEDFGNIYAWLLYNSAARWSFHSDSSCFVDYCCQKEVHTKGNWTAIYQPSIKMKNYEEGKYYIIIKHKKNITNKKFKDLEPIIKQMEKLFLESYNMVLKITKNRWSKKVDGTINDVAQIIDPLRLDGKIMKMSFELRGMGKDNRWRTNDRWTPVKLCKLLGYSIYDPLFDDNDEILKDLEYDENELPDILGWFTEPAIPAIIPSI